MASHNRYRILALLLVLALVFALAALPAAAKEKKRTLDEGTLVIDWFDEDADLEFRETDNVDYLWVSDDFSVKALEDRKLHFPDWPEPEFIGEDAEERDNDDMSLARRMNRLMPQYFHDAFDIAWDGRVDTSFYEGDVQVTGRITDCSTGSVGAKMFIGFGAGAGFTTIDLKMVETQTGELLLALHHRVVSGTEMSTTESKFSKWVGKLSEDIMEDGLVAMYKGGKRVKE
jgi:hypothetical protein